MPRRLGEPQPGSWDYGVDYEKAYRELVKLVQNEGREGRGGVKKLNVVSLFSGTKTQIRAQIGEAVPPLAAKRLAQALAEVLMNLETRCGQHLRKRRRKIY